MEQIKIICWRLRQRKEGESFSLEDIAGGISYLLFLYMDRYGISADKHYIIDAGFIQSETMDSLILLACQINYIQENELLIDFYDYDILI